MKPGMRDRAAVWAKEDNKACKPHADIEDVHETEQIKGRMCAWPSEYERNLRQWRSDQLAGRIFHLSLFYDGYPSSAPEVFVVYLAHLHILQASHNLGDARWS